MRSTSTKSLKFQPRHHLVIADIFSTTYVPTVNTVLSSGMSSKHTCDQDKSLMWSIYRSIDGETYPAEFAPGHTLWESGGGGTGGDSIPQTSGLQEWGVRGQEGASLKYSGDSEKVSSGGGSSSSNCRCCYHMFCSPQLLHYCRSNAMRLFLSLKCRLHRIGGDSVTSELVPSAGVLFINP